MTYWPAVVVAVTLVQFRFRIGTLWIVIGYAVLWIYVILSDAFSNVPDRDAVYLVGSVFRIAIASIFVGATALVGYWWRHWRNKGNHCNQNQGDTHKLGSSDAIWHD